MTPIHPQFEITSQPRPIKILDPVLANQIAAGEVVERPASAIKELIENSLDAGSTSVTVEIREGGRSLMRVADNGHGMSKEDALLALERHATSKIQSVEDLNAIGTLGFRGEALPSIASVSRLQLTTRSAEASSAVQVRVEGGRGLSVSEAAGRMGTEICIQDLFFNVPARRKFLKSAQTESGIIHEAVQRIALAYPQIGFRLIKDGHVSFDLPPHEDSLERVRALFGARVADHLCPVAWTGPVRLHGYVSHPSFHFSSHRHAYTFINGRYVKERLFLGALQRALGQRLPKGRYPFYLLHLDLHPSLVDVNVHPAKTQVRFVNEEGLLDILIKAFSATVRQMNFEDGPSWREKVVDQGVFEQSSVLSEDQSSRESSAQRGERERDRSWREEVSDQSTQDRLTAHRAKIQARLNQHLFGEEVEHTPPSPEPSTSSSIRPEGPQARRISPELFDPSRHERTHVTQAELDAWRRGASQVETPSRAEHYPAMMETHSRGEEITPLEEDLPQELEVTRSVARSGGEDESPRQGIAFPSHFFEAPVMQLAQPDGARAPLPTLNDLISQEALRSLRSVGRADDWWIEEAADGLLLTHLPSARVHAITDHPSPTTLDRALQLSITPKEQQIIEEGGEQLLQLGIELTPFGGSNYRIASIPKGLERESNEALTALIRDILMTSVEGLQRSWVQALLRAPLSTEGRAFTLQWLEGGGRASPQLPPFSLPLPYAELLRRCQHLTPF